MNVVALSQEGQCSCWTSDFDNISVVLQWSYAWDYSLSQGGQKYPVGVYFHKDAGEDRQMREQLLLSRAEVECSLLSIVGACRTPGPFEELLCYRHLYEQAVGVSLGCPLRKVKMRAV